MRLLAAEKGKYGVEQLTLDDMVRMHALVDLPAGYGYSDTVTDRVYIRPIVPVKPYSGYPNRSFVDDLIVVPDKVIRDLGTTGVYGWCLNGSKVIELNARTLYGNVGQAHITERHEARHRLHGISDSNPVGDYVMRALDATAVWERGKYDKVQAYRN